MFALIGWLVYGIVVGSIAKLIYPIADLNFWPTVGLGIAGSYVGGAISYVLAGGGGGIEPAGVIGGIVGAVTALFIYKIWNEK